MANVLDSEEQQHILALGNLGWPLRRIEQATGVHGESVSRYLRRAGIAVRSPGRWGHSDPKAAIDVNTGSAAEAKAANDAITDPAPPRPSRSPAASACEAYRDLIEPGVRLGRNATVIWQDLVDEYGFTASDQCVRRFMPKLRGTQSREAYPVIETAAGEEGQVGYGGDGPMVRHPDTGKYRRMRLFVLTLGFSRKSVRLLRFNASLAGQCPARC